MQNIDFNSARQLSPAEFHFHPNAKHPVGIGSEKRPSPKNPGPANPGENKSPEIRAEYQNSFASYTRALITARGQIARAPAHCRRRQKSARALVALIQN